MPYTCNMFVSIQCAILKGNIFNFCLFEIAYYMYENESKSGFQTGAATKILSMR